MGDGPSTLGERRPPPADNAGPPPVLAVEGLSKAFGSITALSDVSLSLAAGEIRAICGENGAGKSTLVKILTGVYRADRGAVLIDGVARSIHRPQQAQELGLGLVAQELSLVPHLSVLDNIWLGDRTVPLLHRRRRLRERAGRALAALDIGGFDLDTPVGGLSVGQRQLVEISRLLARDARVLILDEPTATLTDVEIERIFAALKALEREGRSVLYITHRLGEVFDVCDSVTVLRNGSVVDTQPVDAIDRERLIEMMLGRAFVEMYPESAQPGGSPMLTVEGLRIPGIVDGFAMTAPRGKIVCIAGQLGSGAAEVVRTLAGLVHDATGRVSVDGRPMRLGSVPAAMEKGVMFVSEDRAGEGIFLHLTVLDNLVSTRLASCRRFGILSWSALRAVASRLAGRVGVDPTRLGSAADELSGGNQQKLAFGRAIEHGRAGVLLMNEPTRGVDLSKPSILAMLTSLTFVGCLAVGMTFITISGNIMSFALGATMSASAMVFLASLAWGVPAALIVALATGGIITLVQGLVIGYVRANRIIISIAALTLITGVANVITAGRRVYPTGSGLEPLTGKFLGVPVEFLAFLGTVVVAHLVLSRTRFGRNIYMVGSSARAAEAAGIRPWATIGGAYFMAGLFSSVAGILIGAHYALGDMELGFGYDYDAIAGVLVGGTAIQGGAGSVLRTVVGVVVIALVEVLLLLYGFSPEMQYLMTGVIVLGAIMVHTKGRRE